MILLLLPPSIINIIRIKIDDSFLGNMSTMHAVKDKERKIRRKYFTSSIFVAKVRESPHVTQANGKTDGGHDKV